LTLKRGASALPGLVVGGWGMVVLSIFPWFGAREPQQCGLALLLAAIGFAAIGLGRGRRAAVRHATPSSAEWVLAGPHPWTGQFSLAISGDAARSYVHAHPALKVVAELARGLLLQQPTRQHRQLQTALPSPLPLRPNHLSEPLELNLTSDVLRVGYAALALGVIFFVDVYTLAWPLYQKLTGIPPISYWLALLPPTLPALIGTFLLRRRVTLGRRDSILVLNRSFGPITYASHRFVGLHHVYLLPPIADAGQPLVALFENDTLVLSLNPDQAPRVAQYLSELLIEQAAEPDPAPSLPE